jgi:hypothetical protein
MNFTAHATNGDNLDAAAPAREQIEQDIIGLELREPGAIVIANRELNGIELSNVIYQVCQALVVKEFDAGNAVSPAIIATKLANTVKGMTEKTAFEALRTFAAGAPAVANHADLERRIVSYTGTLREAHEAGRCRQAGEALLAGGPAARSDALALLKPLSSRGHDYPPAYNAADLVRAKFEPISFLWDGFLLKDHVNLLYGDGGTGKTILALHAGVAVGAGVPLFGKSTTQTTVLHVLAEDDYGETTLRLEEIAAALNVPFKELPIHTWCLPGCDVSLAHVADDGSWQRGPFWEPLRAKLSEIGSCFLVLDTASDVAALNEWLRLPVNAFCKRVLGGICREFGATILLTAHPSKASMADGTGYSGSTAWNNSVRNRLTFEADKEGEPGRVLKVAKSNYGANSELRLFLNGRTFTTAASAGRMPQQERAAVLSAALNMIDNGLCIVRSNGNGQKPADVASAIREKLGIRLSASQTLAHLNALEREGMLRYQPSDNRKHTEAGFRRGPKCAA